MASPNRRAFTKVELVVVVVIIGLLLCLLVPAVQESHITSPKLVCMNRQKHLALATLTFEAVTDRFPGYVNQLEGNEATWVVMLLPYLEQMDLWNEWCIPNWKGIYIEVLVCPSDAPEDITPDDALLSYVANCGRPGDEDTQADGLFFNHVVDGEPIETSIDYISNHDGVCTTLMFSENIQAGNWTDTAEADLGMVWWDKPEACNKINRCIDVGDRPQDIQYARPSSHHGNGVMVSFCDGHVRFLRDDIDYEVYKQLMSPNDGILEEADHD